jgi:hypothetical protein
MAQEKPYFVDSYSDTEIVLRQFFFRFIKVVIPRNQIASTHNALGLLSVETTGHQSYRILEGVSKKQQERTRAALSYR